MCTVYRKIFPKHFPNFLTCFLVTQAHISVWTVGHDWVTHELKLIFVHLVKSVYRYLHIICRICYNSYVTSDGRCHMTWVSRFFQIWSGIGGCTAFGTSRILRGHNPPQSRAEAHHEKLRYTCKIAQLACNRLSVLQCDSNFKRAQDVEWTTRIYFCTVKDKS